MNTTTNYSLKKPEYTDTADIADLNSNMDTLDSTIKSIADTVSGHTTALAGKKPKQTAKDSPSPSGVVTASFIDTISQDADGVITATKKTVQSATQNRDGLLSAADKTKLDGISTGANKFEYAIVTKTKQYTISSHSYATIGEIIGKNGGYNILGIVGIKSGHSSVSITSYYLDHYDYDTSAVAYVKFYNNSDSSQTVTAEIAALFVKTT